MDSRRRLAILVALSAGGCTSGPTAGGGATDAGSADDESGTTAAGSETTAGPAPLDLAGTYFAGELGAASNGPYTLVIASDGTYQMSATDCDYGVGSMGSWMADGDADGVSLVGVDGEPQWFFEEPLQSLLVSPGEDCNVLVASIVDADGQARQELLHRGEVCISSYEHCCQECEPPLPEPGVLEYCNAPPPACE